MAARILIVDDEKLVRWSLRERLRQEGWDTVEAESGAEARKMLTEHSCHLILLDLRLPDSDGLSVLDHLRKLQPDVPVLMMTAYSSLETAIEAMKRGACDYIAKPFNMDELVVNVRRELEKKDLERSLSVRVEAERDTYGMPNLIGQSHAMREIAQLVRKIARSPSTTILLRGESGTGKDLLARAIHYESDRASRLFMNITCTALPDALLESQLFGHEKGAFTDAKTQKKGLFEIADRGTVFLDEIGNMSQSLQAKLLRVLEYKTFKRVGGAKDIEVDVRIIAATNRDLESAIEQQDFREDLYYRFNVLPIYIPPLRERAEDIVPLADFFLGIYRAEMKRKISGFTAAAMDKLQTYNWPGNVRELRNVIERAVLLSEGSEIVAEDIVLGKRGASTQPTARSGGIVLPEKGCRLDDVERALVQQALSRTQGNRSQAADLLGLTRDQVRYRIEKFALEADDA